MQRNGQKRDKKKIEGFVFSFVLQKVFDMDFPQRAFMVFLNFPG
jgi:hypothetical protein